jgi:hypothetical protein
MSDHDQENTERPLDSAELDALASVAGLTLPPGSHAGVRLHLATARRMLATLDARNAAGDELALAPVFRAADGEGS